jgi:hypothetical protein
MPRDPFEVFGGDEYQVPQFSAGGVARIVGLDVWKVQKLVESPRFREVLEASGQLGEGKGSRRWFTTKDVYRIGIAAFIAKDGFAPKLVAEMLEQIDDRDLIDFDEHGEVHTGIKLTRTESGPKLGFFRSGHPPVIKPGGDVYYAIDLSDVTAELDRRISELVIEQRKK